MNIQVKLFARARDLAGSGTVTVELPENASVETLRRTLGQTFPALQPVLPRLLIAVNAAYAREEQTISEGADIACFPPVSGG